MRTLTQEDIKKKLGSYALRFAATHSLIGLGTGSTVYWLIQALAKEVEQGRELKIVPTSIQTSQLAQQAGIDILSLNEIDTLPVTIDGADEVDPHLQLIKGGGGALLQEKMVAAASKQLIVIADETKLVQQLGAFPLPVEVIPSGWKQVQKRIEQWGNGRASLRNKSDQIFVTDNGHYILDCHFGAINDPAALDRQLKDLPGVVETGLFINRASKAIIGYANGEIKEITR